MLASQTSGYRIDEMLRRSDEGRRAHEAARAGRGSRRGGMKRVAAVVAAMATWPLRH
jgi:hypothetical protein